MNVLVTGGTGFIGSRVVAQLLDEKHHVRIFTRSGTLPEQLRSRGAEAVRGDLESPDSLLSSLDDVDLLFHIGEIKNRSAAAAAKNIALMEAIVSSARSRKLRRIVFISSITVAGIPASIPADEGTPPKTVLNDHYTSYKRRCEELLLAIRRDPEAVIIRPAPVYGPGSRYLSAFIDGIRRFGPIGLPFAGDARNQAPLIYVDDLAAAICSAGTSSTAAGEVFNLTDGLSHSWRDLFETIAEHLGTKLRIIPIPLLALRLAALPFDLFSGLFGAQLDPAQYISYFSSDLLFQNDKARRLLSWQPHCKLSEGVAAMIAGYRRA